MTTDKQLYKYSRLTTFAVVWLWILGWMSFVLLMSGALFISFMSPLIGIAYFVLLVFIFGALLKVRQRFNACETPVSELLWHATLAGIGIPFVGWSGCAYIIFGVLGYKL